MRGYHLTPHEQRQVRISIRYLHAKCGNWETLAKLLCVQDDSLRKVLRGGRGVTVELAFRVSRLAKVSMDVLLGGGLLPPGTCPHCGHPPDEDQRRSVRAAGLARERQT